MGRPNSPVEQSLACRDSKSLPLRHPLSCPLQHWLVDERSDPKLRALFLRPLLLLQLGTRMTPNPKQSRLVVLRRSVRYHMLEPKKSVR
jgi:hypothetical protein